MYLENQQVRIFDIVRIIDYAKLVTIEVGNDKSLVLKIQVFYFIFWS